MANFPSPAFPAVTPVPNFPNNPGYNLYVGARYVPKFSDQNGGVWTNTIAYEALTIVLYEGDSYTSRQPVPVGIDITNTEYWALTGQFNAQYVELLQKVNTNTQDIATTNQRIDALESYIATPQQYGAIGDGVHDDTEAIQTCVANHDNVHIPTGVYRISDTIQITRAGQTIWGDGSESYIGGSYNGSVLICAMNKTAVEVARTAWGTSLKDFGVYSTLATDPGGDGFFIHNWTVRLRLENLRARNFHNGFTIGATSQGYISFCAAVDNFNNGFYFSNVVDDYQFGNSMQWDFLNCYGETNNNNGVFYYNGQNTTMPLGSIINYNTFANGGAGLRINDSTATAAITGIRISSCFMGNDGKGGIVLTKTSYPAEIAHCQLESAGTGGTGRNRSIPESLSAYNIEIQASATQITVTDTMMVTGSLGGIYIGCAGYCTVANCTFFSNGLHGGENAAQIRAAENTQFLLINGNMFTAGNYALAFPYGGYDIVTSNVFRSLSKGIFSPDSGSTSYMQIANNLNPTT